ncbi:MAG: TM1802 family CRISPR-associated protein [Candidatus Paceibacterota bacterium]
MLQTLLRIGEWQSQGKSNWDRFLEAPKVEYKDNRGNEITNYVLPIIIDLDEGIVIAEKNNLKEYREKFVSDLKALEIRGGNNKAIYATVPGSKLIQLYKTFFGKENENSKEGELKEALKKDNDNNLNERFELLLDKIFSLKDKFLAEVLYHNENKAVEEISIKSFESKFGFSRLEKIVLVYLEVKFVSIGIKEPIAFAKLDEYLGYLSNKFLGKLKSKEGPQNKPPSTCYASGIKLDDVQTLDLPRNGYSINSMFVTTTRNYASDFKEKNFRLNYQLGKKNQEFLSFASNFLLDQYKVRIANIDHVIIPTFLKKDDIDLKSTLTGIKRKSDMLFSFDTLDHVAQDIADETYWVYWINFIAFESNGNFFKSTETIKDVSKFHFQNVLKAFYDVHKELKEFDSFDWEDILLEYGKRWRFNFNSVYNLIPLRKDKERKNKALDLFKAILEKRPVEKQMLFGFFKELILCHYYERYNSYTNVPKSNKDFLKRSIKVSVIKYLAFIKVLRNLKLINMEEHNETKDQEGLNLYEKSIQEFFEKMNFSQPQKAMFYLGRMLNSVEWIQVQKKIKKTVINLVNFNGLEKDDIQRLRNDLINKARQHSKMGKVIFTDGKFSELFDYNNWHMSRNEALFFLLSGYSYGTKGADAEQRETIEKEIEEIV